eukprot:GAHX01002722.1.p1 GENE.GAHX01002722.1~~GAHX01002722.1.p1  ORF type:complete len:328 (+),score=36.25 GAHX01002722.1:321-1304(+)
MKFYYLLVILESHLYLQANSTSDINLHQSLRFTCLVKDTTHKFRNFGISAVITFNHKKHDGTFLTRVTNITLNIYYFKAYHWFKRDFGLDGKLFDFLENSEHVKEIQRFSHKDNLGIISLSILNITELNGHLSTIRHSEEYIDEAEVNYSYFYIYLKQLNIKNGAIIESPITSTISKQQALKFKMVYKAEINRMVWHNEIVAMDLEGTNVIYKELDNASVDTNKFNYSKELEGLLFHEPDRSMLMHMSGHLLVNCLREIELKEANKQLKRNNETSIEIKSSRFVVAFENSHKFGYNKRNYGQITLYTVASLSGILFLIYIIKELANK